VETNACFSAPIVLAPGRRHTATVTVASRADAAIESRRTNVSIPTGTYRAAWFGVLTSYDKTRPTAQHDELPLEQRVSAPFDVVNESAR
jgi:hypothetical protein